MTPRRWLYRHNTVDGHVKPGTVTACTSATQLNPDKTLQDKGRWPVSHSPGASGIWGLMGKEQSVFLSAMMPCQPQSTAGLIQGSRAAPAGLRWGRGEEELKLVARKLGASRGGVNMSNVYFWEFSTNNFFFKKRNRKPDPKTSHGPPESLFLSKWDILKRPAINLCRNKFAQCALPSHVTSGCCVTLKVFPLGECREKGLCASLWTYVPIPGGKPRR